MRADTAGSFRTFVVSRDLCGNNIGGTFGVGGVQTMKAAGTVPIGAYVRKSATSFAVESSGVLSGGGAPPPDGTLGVALAASAPATSTVLVWLYGRPIAFGMAVPTLAKATATLGASFATTSLTLVNVPSLEITVTTGARRLLIGCSGALSATNPDNDAEATIQVAGVDVSPAPLRALTPTAMPFTIYHRSAALTAGSNTVRMRLRRLTNVGSLSHAVMHGGTRLWVQELLG